MRGYLYTGDYNSFDVLIDGLSAYAGCTFKLVAFAAGDNFEQGAAMQITGGATSDGAWEDQAYVIGPGTTVGFTTGDDRLISNGLADAYNVYDGTLDGTPLDINVGPWLSSFSIFNGLPASNHPAQPQPNARHHQFGPQRHRLLAIVRHRLCAPTEPQPGGTNWTPATYPISTNGATQSVTISNPTGRMFFRLMAN